MASISVNSLVQASLSVRLAGVFAAASVSGSSLQSAFLGGASSISSFAFKAPISHSQKRHGVLVQAAAAEAEVVENSDVEVRFRLNNLAPAPGSRRKEMRKGRGISAGQGASCGFGMRGQKSRSGSGVRPGFEGGQMPLYRRLPKLKGIAGGMGAGLPKYVAVNLEQIAELGLDDGEEVTLEVLKELGVVKPTGRERKLPLKILGDGELSSKLTIKAGAFSASAKEKLEAAGCTIEVLPGKKKFLPLTVVKKMARAQEYFAKKAAAGDGAAESS